MSLGNNWFDIYFKATSVVDVISIDIKNYFVNLEPYFQIGRETSFKVGDVTEQQLKENILNEMYEYEI